jgi:hypothetical protein
MRELRSIELSDSNVFPLELRYPPSTDPQAYPQPIIWGVESSDNGSNEARLIVADDPAYSLADAGFLRLVPVDSAIGIDNWISSEAGPLGLPNNVIGNVRMLSGTIRSVIY